MCVSVSVCTHTHRWEGRGGTSRRLLRSACAAARTRAHHGLGASDMCPFHTQARIWTGLLTLPPGWLECKGSQFWAMTADHSFRASGESLPRQTPA